jgi:hypothetical protein
MLHQNMSPDYLNEQYFEDWGSSVNKNKDLTRNGTDGRVYGGDCDLIHIPDGRRAEFGQRMAALLEVMMRANAENRTEEQRLNQLLCPGCFMVAVFNMATELARANGQPFSELGKSMAKAFAELAEGGTDRIEHIIVELDGDVA